MKKPSPAAGCICIGFAGDCQRLVAAIKQALEKVTPAPSFLKVAFIDVDGLRKAMLVDEHLTRPRDYFLGIRTKEDHRSLVRLTRIDSN